MESCALSWALTAGPLIAHQVFRLLTESDGTEHWLSFEGLAAGRWWLPLTATLSHNGAEHLVVNLVLYTPVACALEPVLGAFGTVLVFYSAALAGWVASLISSRIRYPESHAFVQTCGASPGLYGVMYCAAALVPSAAVTSGAVSRWAWPLGLAILPTVASLLTSSGRTQGKSSLLCSPKLHHAVVVGVIAAAVNNLLPGTGTALAWLVLCNGVNVSQRALQLLREPALRSLEYPGADEASHLGGAFWGLTVAAFVVLRESAWQPVLQLHWVIVFAMFFGLVARHLSKF